MLLRLRLLDFALGLPDAWEDFPWGESVVKVRKKVFVFLGLAESSTPAMTIKLADSHEQALSSPSAAPSGYGLGRSGWVTVFLDDHVPPFEVLTDWIEESYRIVAPKRLVAESDRDPTEHSSPRAGGAGDSSDFPREGDPGPQPGHPSPR